MAHILILFLLAFIFFFLAYKVYQKNKSENSSSPVLKLETLLDQNEEWITEHWNTAKKEREEGELKSVPKWFFHEATKQQKQRIRNEGYDIKEGTKLTKGEATDIIGLFEPVDEEDKEILGFFDVSLHGMNRSRAKYEVGKLFRDPENVEKWKGRGG